MSHKNPSPYLPRVRGYDQAYQEAYESAIKQLREKPDLENLCQHSGAILAKDTGSPASIALAYLGQTHHIQLADPVFTAKCSESLTSRDRLIILHYLNTAKDTHISGKLIDFKELPEGRVYYPTFIKRTIKPLIENFASNPARLLSISQKLGGKISVMGDISVELNALPHIPIVFIFWQGDEELPPEGNILFDNSITSYLPTEDITVLCEIIVWKLVGLNRAAPA
jgi:hypothetical protein